jgi:hypothetical protein
MVPQREFAAPTHALRRYKSGYSETTGEKTSVAYTIDLLVFFGAQRGFE